MSSKRRLHLRVREADGQSVVERGIETHRHRGAVFIVTRMTTEHNDEDVRVLTRMVADASKKIPGSIGIVLPPGGTFEVYEEIRRR